MATQTLMEKIETSVSRSKSNVFLRKDFKDLGGYDQIGRALRSLVADGKLVKVGYGVYVRAEPSSFTGNPVPTIPLMEIGLETMEKLGIDAGVGRALRRYNQGESTQIPMKAILDVKGSRIVRQIGFGSKKIRYER